MKYMHLGPSVPGVLGRTKTKRKRNEICTSSSPSADGDPLVCHGAAALLALARSLSDPALDQPELWGQGRGMIYILFLRRMELFHGPF